MAVTGPDIIGVSVLLPVIVAIYIISPILITLPMGFVNVTTVAFAGPDAVSATPNPLADLNFQSTAPALFLIYENHSPSFCSKSMLGKAVFTLP
jgi:hypothetical protein